MNPGRILIPVRGGEHQSYGEQQRGLVVTFSLTGSFPRQQLDRMAVRRADDCLAGVSTSLCGRIYRLNVSRVYLA